jgi:hypothetical protein
MYANNGLTYNYYLTIINKGIIMMKTTMLFFFVALFGCINLLAEENEVTEPKQKHIIGARVGLQLDKSRFFGFDYKINGYGADIFYQHYVSSLPFKFVNQLYLSANAGYRNYNKNYDIIKEDIPVTVGLCVYNYDDYELINYYFAVEFGALYRTKEKIFNESSYDVKITISSIFCFSIPLSESLNLNISFRDYYVIKDSPKYKFSLGFSHSF